MTTPSIYDFVKQQENLFETEDITLGDNFSWNFRKHVQLIFHLVNGVFFTGANDWLRPFKAVMEPMLNLSKWTEDIEVNDVVFFIESQNGKVLSFLIKKFHDEVYTKEHDLDTLFDQITESDNTYGGVVLQKGVEMPEVIPLNSIAFCDQTDVLGSPIAFKHYFSPAKLRGMGKYGWGEEKNGASISLDELCVLAESSKDASGQSDKKNQVPGKTVEVYIVRGNLPDQYLLDNDDMEYYCNQIQVIAFYVDKDGKKNGVTLYRKEEDEGNLKFFTSKEVYQRGLGRGVGEALLPAQIWSNFLSIHKMNMLEASSKVLLQTDDPAFHTKNNIANMENLEVSVLEEGKSIGQIPNVGSANVALMDNALNEWLAQAQLSAAAFDPILGKEATSGTTFRGQERTVAQGKGLHDQKRGKRAKFIESQLYRDWIIPDIKKEILKGKKFLATLTTDELRLVSEQMSVALTNKRIKEMMMSGKAVTKEMQDEMTRTFRTAMIKKGDKHLTEILKDEFKDVEIKLGISVAGKQKDLASMSDKLLSVFQFIFANPAGFQQAMQIPALAKSFENILEFGGMSIGDFSSLLNAPQVPAPTETTQTPALLPTEVVPA